MMDLIMSWICSAVATGFEKIIEFFSGTFSYDIATFNDVFSFAGDAYDLIRKIAMSLALVIAAWQVIQFFWRGPEKAADTPPRAALNAVIAVGFIYYGNYIFDIILKFCKYPYEALFKLDATNGGMTSFASSTTTFLSDAFAGASMLLYLIMLILIGFSMVKLLLEIVERYCVAFVLVYLSPLAASTLASSTTSGIYKKYFTMFVSQCILIFLNSWCLKMACSGLDGDRGSQTALTSFLLCYAFLRIAAKMDSYLNQLGLNAAITGQGLGAEIFGAGMSLMGGLGGGGGRGGMGNPVGNALLGASKVTQTWANRLTPAAAITRLGMDGAVGAGKGWSEAYRSGGIRGMVNNQKDVYQKARQDGSGRFGAAVKAAFDNPGTHGAGKGIAKSDNMFSQAGRDLSNYASQKIDQTFDGRTGEPSRDILHPETERLTSADLSPTQNNENIKAWSENQHLAQDAFAHVKANDLTVDNTERVAAVAKGLGVGGVSTEANSFIQAGFGQDGVSNVSYQMDKNGIHAAYDKDGYRHKMNVYDQAQYDKIAAQDREAQNLQKYHTADGKRYYVGTTKKKLEPDPS